MGRPKSKPDLTRPQVRSVSFGGGVQSTALLVLAVQGLIDFKLFLFANVGADSEHPATIRYVHDVAIPYAEAHGLELKVLDRVMRDGSIRTLYAQTMKESRSIGLPMRVGQGGFMRRNCTSDFKIRVIDKELRRRGAHKLHPALTAIGISLDELHRARSGPPIGVQDRCYPLIEQRLTRTDCEALILSAGLPIPPKSSCFFCPYHTNDTWQKLRENEPELFAKSVALEQVLTSRMARLQPKDPPKLFLHNRKVPLPMATTAAVQDESILDMCESGYCHT